MVFNLQGAIAEDASKLDGYRNALSGVESLARYRKDRRTEISRLDAFIMDRGVLPNTLSSCILYFGHKDETMVLNCLRDGDACPDVLDKFPAPR